MVGPLFAVAGNAFLGLVNEILEFTVIEYGYW
jgi:hypothetical protein